jgi:hypothetical protein
VVSLATYQLGRDRLLAKSAQGVQHRPWSGLTGSTGPLKSAEIRDRWCQPWVSDTRLVDHLSFRDDQLIRTSGHLVQDRPMPSVPWAAVPELSVGDSPCLVARQSGLAWLTRHVGGLCVRQRGALSVTACG